jgi:methionyl aminopeptidase
MKPKTDKEIISMREGGKMLATVLAKLRPEVKAGVTTQHLASIASRELEKLGGQPAFYGYQGFPSVICISVNDEVVHGVPGERVLAEGDVVGLDFGVKHQGLITDAAISVPVGKVSQQVHKLIKDTEAALHIGIDQVQGGAKTGDIGESIERYLKQWNYGIVRDLVGHGVGHNVHESPEVPNFGTSGTGSMLKTGMTIAIEPMVTLGSHRVYLDSSDGWTIKTQDGSTSAHFEHTVLVTEDSYEILTLV